MTAPLASYSESTFDPDRLLAGGHPSPQVARNITLVSGENRTRGAVLGKITGGVSPSAAADAGNTGDGTVGSLTAGTGAQEGVYVLTCIEPATDAGEFQVEDPQGVVIGTATVAVAFTGQINFTIADGSTDFAAGDIFRITLTAGTGKYKLSAAAATDGSQTPDAVLAHDADASGGDIVTVAYFDGHFNEDRVTLGAGHTAASVREGLRAKGIHLHDVASATTS